MNRSIPSRREASISVFRPSTLIRENSSWRGSQRCTTAARWNTWWQPLRARATSEGSVSEARRTSTPMGDSPT